MKLEILCYFPSPRASFYKLQRGGVHAVALVGGRRSVVEDMAEVGIAAGAEISEMTFIPLRENTISHGVQDQASSAL
jgi:hypothetical protein